MAAYYTFEDLSGSTSTGTKTDNPYHDLIESCHNDPVIPPPHLPTSKTKDLYLHSVTGTNPAKIRHTPHKSKCPTED